MRCDVCGRKMGRTGIMRSFIQRRYFCCSEECADTAERLEWNTGEENRLTIGLDNVGIDLGGDRRILLNGNVTVAAPYKLQEVEAEH